MGLGAERCLVVVFGFRVWRFGIRIGRGEWFRVCKMCGFLVLGFVGLCFFVGWVKWYFGLILISIGCRNFVNILRGLGCSGFWVWVCKGYLYFGFGF